MMAKANIKDLLSKPKILTTEWGDIPIHKLTVGKKLEIMELVDKNQNQKAAFEIIKYTLERAFPEATTEELDNISDDILEIISEETMKYNGLKSDERPQ